jgi:hypothetical protein
MKKNKNSIKRRLRKMGRQTYAEVINSVKVMVSGLKANSDRVSKRGLSNDFITNLDSVMQDAMRLDNEQESLKAKLKQKTAELEGAMVKIDQQMSEAKKVVKLEMAKESWKEFGIQDKTEKKPPVKKAAVAAGAK